MDVKLCDSEPTEHAKFTVEKLGEIGGEHSIGFYKRKKNVATKTKTMPYQYHNDMVSQRKTLPTNNFIQAPRILKDKSPDVEQNDSQKIKANLKTLGSTFSNSFDKTIKEL